MGKLLHNWIDVNGQGVATENEIFTVVGLCCHHSILRMLFVRPCERNVLEEMLHMEHYYLSSFNKSLFLAFQNH